jgi:hypothetical protein
MNGDIRGKMAKIQYLLDVHVSCGERVKVRGKEPTLARSNLVDKSI